MVGPRILTVTIAKATLRFRRYGKTFSGAVAQTVRDTECEPAADYGRKETPTLVLGNSCTFHSYLKEFELKNCSVVYLTK